MTNVIGISIIVLVFLVIIYYFWNHKKSVKNTPDETSPEIGDEWKETSVCNCDNCDCKEEITEESKVAKTVQEKKVLIDTKLAEIKDEELKKVSETKTTETKKVPKKTKSSTSKTETKKAKTTTKKSVK